MFGIDFDWDSHSKVHSSRKIVKTLVPSHQSNTQNMNIQNEKIVLNNFQQQLKLLNQHNVT